MIVNSRKAQGFETLGLRRFILRRKLKLAVATALISVTALGIVAMKFRSPIGKELSHAYWPKQALEEQNLGKLLPYIGKFAANGIRTSFTQADAPTLFVDVKFKHFRKLKEWRSRVVERGFALEKDRQYVPAMARHGTTRVRAKIRLKGDIFDHYDIERWSFRLKIRRGDAVLGMRSFSVQEPERRGFAAEAIFFEHLRQYDILVPRYFFVNLVLNGEPWGLMAIEEFPSKELMESGHRRESVVFHYDDRYTWWALANDDRALSRYYSNHFNLNFIAYGMKRIRKNPKLYKLFLRAMALLEGWRRGELETSDIFDVERWARTIAMSEIWHSRHQLKYHNLRLYFNPLTERFEPIVYDRGRHYYNDKDRQDGTLILRDVPFVRQLLSDPTMKQEFERSLRSLADDIVSGQVIRQLRPFADRISKQLIYDRPYEMAFPFETLAARSSALLSRGDFDQKTVRAPIYSDIKSKTFASLAHGTFYRNDDGISLELWNKIPLKVRVCGLTLKDHAKGFNKELFIEQSEQTIILPPAEIPQSRAPSRVFKFKLPRQEMSALSHGTTVGVCLNAANADQSVYDNLPEVAPPIRRSVNTPGDLADRFPFLDAPNNHELTVRPGVWDIDEPIIVPNGVTLNIPGGVTLKMKPGTMIAVHGPTRFIGTSSAPIVMQSASDTEKWNGIAVLQDNSDRSEWRHVKIVGADSPNYRGWTTTGAVTFHRGMVVLMNVAISRSNAEDALNVISGKVEINGLNISHVRSDAFDCDFCRGKMVRLQFSDVGGDGLDVSGTAATVEDSLFTGIGDKALSVGERSHITASDIVVRNSAFAFVSKDGSSLELDRAEMAGIREVSFMAYKKKPEYEGRAKITARNVLHRGSARLSRSTADAVVYINGEEHRGEQFDVDELYQSGSMQKR